MPVSKMVAPNKILHFGNFGPLFFIGAALYLDAFASYAVEFGRYC